MKMLKISVMSTLLLGLVGCGDLWDKEPEEIELGPRQELIINAEKIKDSLSLGVVSPNEIIEVHLRGEVFTPQFGPVYDKSFQSTWSKQVCMPRPCPMCHIKMDCFDTRQKGQCVHRYRDQLEDKRSPTLFDKPVVDISVKIKIGKNIYHLGEISKHEGQSIVTRFKVSKEMLIEDEEAFLIVIPRPSNGNTKIGFQGYGRCDGHGQRSFSSGGPKDSKSINNNERFEYRASVIIEYPNKA